MLSISAFCFLLSTLSPVPFGQISNSASASFADTNARFETGRLKECCDLLPEFKRWFKKLTPCIVDLLLPFRGFRYYHPKQNGSASMKAVLPAITGQGYEHLAIQKGNAAVCVRTWKTTAARTPWGCFRSLANSNG